MDEERAARIRQARQVLAGNELQPPHEPWAFEPEGALDPIAQRYLLVVGALALVSLILFLVWGMGPASAVLFLLALALVAGWLVF
jgi:Flp pilus assembly protein TadB